MPYRIISGERVVKLDLVIDKRRYTRLRSRAPCTVLLIIRRCSDSGTARMHCVSRQRKLSAVDHTTTDGRTTIPDWQERCSDRWDVLTADGDVATGTSPSRMTNLRSSQPDNDHFSCIFYHGDVLASCQIMLSASTNVQRRGFLKHLRRIE